MKINKFDFQWDTCIQNGFMDSKFNVSLEIFNVLCFTMKTINYILLLNYKKDTITQIAKT